MHERLEATLAQYLAALREALPDRDEGEGSPPRSRSG
jgi:hypothetical protein